MVYVTASRRQVARQSPLKFKDAPCQNGWMWFNQNG